MSIRKGGGGFEFVAALLISVAVLIVRPFRDSVQVISLQDAVIALSLPGVAAFAVGWLRLGRKARHQPEQTADRIPWGLMLWGTHGLVTLVGGVFFYALIGLADAHQIGYGAAFVQAFGLASAMCIAYASVAIAALYRLARRRAAGAVDRISCLMSIGATVLAFIWALFVWK